MRKRDNLDVIFEEILNRCSYQIQDNLMLVDREQTIFYRDFAVIVADIESQLESFNLRAGDSVALRFESSLHHIIFYFTLIKLRITLININPNDVKAIQERDLSILDTQYIIQDIDPKENSLSTQIIYVDRDFKLHSKKEVLKKSNPYSEYAYLFYNSGTTGKKKIIGITRLALAEQILRDSKVCNFRVGESYCTITNLYFNTPKRRVLSALYNGLKIFLPNSIDRDIISFCRENSIQHLALTTDQALFLTQNINLGADTKESYLPELNSLVVSGSPVSNSLKKIIVKFITKNLYICYGSNESGELTVTTLDRVLKYENIVGKPFDNVEVKILNDSGDRCAVGEVGNIVIYSKDMIRDYLGNPKESREAFKEEGFFIGDLGKFTEDGDLILKGRRDDMMIFTGVNIYPIEIESILNSHQDVLESAVFPMQIGNQRDIPFAAVVTTKAIEEDALHKWCEKFLGWRRAKKILFLDKLPKSSSGKVMKRDLIDLVNREIFLNSKYQQSMSRVELKLEKSLNLDLTLIDSWFVDIFKIELEECKSSLTKRVDKRKRYIIQIVWRFLLLRKKLLQTLFVPIFDSGDILKIEEDSQKFMITLELVRVENMPTSIFANSFKMAIDILINQIRRDRTSKDIETLFEKIDREFIALNRALSNSGKSTIPILREAHKKKIPFYYLGAGVYRLGWGSRAKLLDRSSTCFDSAVGSKLSENKFLTTNLIAKAGVPTPKNRLISTYQEAIEFSKDLNFPIVIKPIDGNRGEGVTIDIVDRDMLRVGFDRAIQNSKLKKVLIEEQIDGVCHRVLVANSKVLYALERLPKSIVADGENSIERLVDIANRDNLKLPPWERVEFFPFDEEAIDSINRAGYSKESIPEKGILIPLRKIESTQFGGIDRDVSSIIHPENIDIAIRASELLGLYIAGVDIISTDISKPWYENGAVINEVNFAPLYGGGDISKRTIPYFLEDFIEKDGKIPIYALVGSSEIERAFEIQKRELKNRVNSFITTSSRSYAPNGEVIYKFKTLKERVEALLFDSRVDELIIIADSKDIITQSISNIVNNQIIFLN